MAIIQINLGTTAGDHSGTKLRVGGQIINANFVNLDARLSNVEENQFTGVNVYETLADLPATGIAQISYKVTNDSTLSNNGYYTWNGSAYVKEAELVEGAVQESNTSTAVSGKAVYDFGETLKTDAFQQTSVLINYASFHNDNYLTNTGASGGQPGYQVYMYKVVPGFKYSVVGQVTALNTSFAAFGFYTTTAFSSYLSGIQAIDNGVNAISYLVEAPATAQYLYVTQDISDDTIEVREILSTSKIVENPIKPDNAVYNYQLENSVGITPENGDTTTPLYHLISDLNNSTNLGYQKSDCPTNYPALTFNLGTSALSSSYLLVGVEITDAESIRNILGKTVVFSYYIKHDAAIAGLYLNQVVDGGVTVDYTEKQINTKLNQWYKIEHTITITSTSFKNLSLRAYPNAAVGVNVNVEFSSFSLRLQENQNIKYIFHTNSKWEALRNNIINNNVYISLPAEISIVEGNRLEIFKHSIVKAINPDNYFLKATVVSGTPKGVFYDRVYIYDCEVGDANMTLEFTLTDGSLNILSKQQVVIKPVAKASNPSSQFNILLIGDSFTQTATYPTELYRRLHDTGGTPTADGLTNVNFIGTNAFGGVPREGWSGMSWPFFLGASSPFYNSGTSQIDFANYISVNSYASIDGVVILLGTNETSDNTVISSLLDKLIAFNSSIKGIVTGKIFPTPFGGAGSVGISTNQFYYNQLQSSLEYNRRVQALIETSYSANFKFVDILPTFDIMNNMPFSNVAANYRNQTTLVKQGTDNVHPASSGYLQIADKLYAGVHDFIL